MKADNSRFALTTGLALSSLIVFPEVAQAMPQTPVQSSLFLTGSVCVAALGTGAVTAFVMNRISKKRISALSAQIELLSSQLHEAPVLSGKHAVADHAHFSLSQIIAAREAQEARYVEDKEAVSCAPIESEQSEEAQIAQDVAASYVTNPLDSIEEAPSQEHKENGMHTAVSFEDDEVIDAISSVSPVSTKKEEPTGEIDYEKVAEAYVKKKSFKERMLARSKGVQSVLLERLGGGQNAIEDIPVIRRADGSVGDVGESWWKPEENTNAALFDEDFGVDEPSLEASAELYTSFIDASVSAQFSKVSEKPSSKNTSGFVPRLVTDRSEISARVADPFAPQASAEEVSSAKVQGDIWLEALDAMDKKIDDNLLTGMPQVVFSDVVGDQETLDEPDGLEEQTNFLSFKAPGGHPEVTDTASYVNFLVENEFEAKSKGFGKHVKRYLKVS